MRKICVAVLIVLIAGTARVSGSASDDPQQADPSSAPLGSTLRQAIAAEARQLRIVEQRLTARSQESQGASEPQSRHWCVRHLVACGALVGFPVGFLVGLTHAPEDFQPTGFALLIGGPIGAGIGAAVGGIIWAYTTPKQP